MLYYDDETTGLISRCGSPKATCTHRHHWYLAVPAREKVLTFSTTYHLDEEGEIARCGSPLSCLLPKHFLRRRDAVKGHKEAYDYSGRWRPLPNPYSSLLERELADLVEVLGYTVVRNSRSIIGPYELDLYLPQRRVALEFNGTHWHSDAQIRKAHGVSARAYHETKLALCEEQGIRLGFVWESSWLCNPVALMDAVAELVQFRRTSSLLGLEALPPRELAWHAADLQAINQKRERIEAKRAKLLLAGKPFGEA